MADGPADTLIYGPDLKLRNETFRALRKQVFSSPDAETLDLETLDATKLSPEILQAALVSLPAFRTRRMVHLVRAEKIDKHLCDLLVAFLKEPHPHVIVVLEAETWDETTKMRQTLGAFFKKVGTDTPEGATVFDLMGLVQAGDASVALRTLKNIFDNGEEPERLLGGMLWTWSNKTKGRVAPPVYKKGLLLLQEADIALKRSRFPERENALEILIVKLSLLTRSRA